MSLEDFSESSDATFEDFESVGGEVTPNKAKSSINNKALMNIALSENPEEAAKNYSSAMDEFETTGKSETLKSLEKQSQVELVKKAEETLIGELLNEDTSDENKMAMAGGFTVLKEDTAISTQEQYIDLVLTKENGSETAEQEAVLSSMIGLSQPYYQNKVDLQYLVNSHIGGLDFSYSSVYIDMLELMIPAAYNKQSAGVLGSLKESIEGEDTTGFMEFLFAGNSRMDMTRMIKNLPMEDRLPLQKLMLEAVNGEEGSIYLTKDNDFLKMEFMNSVVDGTYSTSDQITDNILSVLDFIPFVNLLSKSPKFLSRLGDAGKSKVVGSPNPTSIGQTTLENNPLEGYKLVEEAMENEDVAKAVFGTDSKGVAVEALGPKPMTDSGIVTPIPSHKPARVRADQETLDKANDSGQIYIQPEEKKQVFESIQTVLQDAVGLTLRPELTQVGVGAGVEIKAVYTAGKTGFSSAEDAMAQALYSLRDTGIGVEDIKILKRTEKGYESAEEVGEDLSNYLVQIDKFTELKSGAKKKGLDIELKDKEGGFTGVIQAEDVGGGVLQVHNASVDAIKTGGGVGTKLYKKLIEEARAAGYTKIVSDNSVSTPARSIWKKLGGIKTKKETSKTEGSINADQPDSKNEFTVDETPLYSLDLTLTTPKASGDYIIQVQHKGVISSDMITDFTPLSVINNQADRVGSLAGNVGGSGARMILDPASMLHKSLVMGASVADDAGKLITRKINDLGVGFSTPFRKMGDAEKTKVSNYIKKANLEGIEHTPTQLKSQGFSDSAISALTAFRTAWDTVYWLKNAEMVKNLKAQKYKSLKVGSENLLVRKTQMDFSNNRVYNPETKQLQTLQPDEMRKLYKDGGYVGKSRTPMNIDEENIANVLVKNDSKSYARVLNESDAVHEYRLGYYEVNYDAPIFIDKIIRNSKGEKIYTQAVGVARSVEEANLMRTKWAKAENKADDYYGVVRENKKNAPMSPDDQYDIARSMGTTTERARGKRLGEEPTQPFNGGVGDTLVQDPIDALTDAARSIGDKVAMRDWLEISKARFVSQFGKYVPEVNGLKTFPTEMSGIKFAGEPSSKGIADARTTWEYINSMENGYINSVDEWIKGAFNSIATAMGEKGNTRREKAFRWAGGGRGLTTAIRGAGNALYIKLNPQRQHLVQSHQMVRLAAANSTYSVTKMIPDLVAVQKARVTGEPNELLDFVMDSGQLDAIKTNNLVKDSMMEITNQSKSGIKGALTTGYNTVERVSSKIGFEAGESNNIITTLLAFRDKAIKNGKDMSKPEDRDEVYALARNWGYGMNKANIMPYQENAASLIMQFLHVPHKGITQTTTNRILTNKEKAKAMTLDIALFGVPTYWAADKWFADLLPEDPMIREALQDGMEGLIFNGMINSLSDQYSELDFTSFSPTSGAGFADLVMSFLDGEGLIGLVSNSPSGSLFIGSNPRVSNFMVDIARFAGAMPEYPPITFSQLSKSFVSMSSGMSNAFNAIYSNEHGKVVNRANVPIDADVTSAESIGLLLGLPTKTSKKHWDTEEKIYLASESFRNDVKTHYSDITRMLGQTDENDLSANQRILETMAFGFKVFNKNQTEALKVFKSLVARDAKKGDSFLIDRLYKMSNMMSYAKWKILVQGAPLTPFQIKELLKVGKVFNEHRERNE